MMRIEPAKNSQTDKKDSLTNKSENSSRNASAQTKVPDAPPPTAGAFAKILDEARKQAGKDKDLAGKADSSERETKSSESEGDAKTGRSVQSKKDLEEKNKHESGSGGGDEQSNDENQSAALVSLGFLAETKPLPDGSIPAARSILHVADLERIISTIRTQNFKNAQQITIALKHSVLEGLQIRLTMAENGKLKAEFLASNEQIKNQLNARRRELSEIFKKRSVNFSELNILDSSEFSDQSSSVEQDSLLSVASSDVI